MGDTLTRLTAILVSGRCPSKVGGTVVAPACLSAPPSGHSPIAVRLLTFICWRLGHVPRAVGFTDLSLAASPTLAAFRSLRLTLFDPCANMQIELVSQIFLRSNGVVRKSSWSDELAPTLGA